MLKKAQNAADYIQKKIDIKPDIGLILGSGLGIMAEEIKDARTFKYKEIPEFPVSTVEGHAGRLIFGKLEGNTVAAMQGRFHYYEGYDMSELTLPVRVLKLLGIKKLMVTNAAGGINFNYKPGNFMIITDHINLMGDNPLRGKNYKEFGPRFPDMSEPYNKDLIDLAEKVAVKNLVTSHKGIYVGMIGSSFETPAEIRFLRTIGGDAVGMSTVPEVIVANHMGIDVLGISCITNMAAGILPQPLTHKEVIEITEKVKPEFIKLVRGILQEL
ncbi:MAG: purine-nucleoside phosphorylase [Halanaerobiales bacterium]